ncbi:hypothetical protein [uncultured Pseudoteredinibacter sp.]|uniref:hypothetical protein n=1 Tax=uncultured Pseudoteredinibacter sp. TaxID=1641701 RepID=UPI00262A4D53|nr:hypothetical protein [uncultured Pseudoteredinibacter sp.]
MNNPLGVFLTCLASISTQAVAGLDTQICNNSDLKVSYQECFALVDIYNSTNGQTWHKQENWGDLPIENWFGVKVENNRVVSISLPNNNLDGNLPHSINSLSYLKTLIADNNRLQGVLSENIGFISNLERVSLSHNMIKGKLPRSLFEASSLNYLDLSNNQLNQDLPNFSNSPKAALLTLKLANNQITGVLPDSFSQSARISFLDLSNNLLSGEIPNNLCSMCSEVLLAHNAFNGELPEHTAAEYMYSISLQNNEIYSQASNLSKEISAAGVRIDISENELFGSYTSNLSNRGNSKNTIDYKNQRSHSLDIRSIALNGPGTLKAINTDSLNRRIFQLIPFENANLTSITGCNGKLEGNMYFLPQSQQSCSVEVNFDDCQGQSCIFDFGKTANVPNVSLETPKSNRLISGVVQLRGWFKDEQQALKSAKKPAIYAKIDDAAPIEINIGNLRSDVYKAMKINNSTTPIGWNLLFYSGNLSNGQHELEIYSEDGVLINKETFTAFTIQSSTEQSEKQYINQSYPHVTVNDFPYANSSVELAFNTAEQNFSIISQIDASGKQTRSKRQWFSGSPKSINNGSLINGTPAIKIEYPNKNQDATGVISIRGWHYNTESASEDIELFIKIDDEAPIPTSRVSRPDVLAALNKDQSSQRVGWSTLFYSGNLGNGLHRIRLLKKSGSQYEVLAEDSFTSFTANNKSGEIQYFSDLKKEIEVDDFPFSGSTATLSFDTAGQNFSIVKQKLTN